jgi:protein tyrosine phosphatase
MQESLANLGVSAPYMAEICEKWLTEGQVLDVVDLNDNNFGIPGAKVLAHYLPKLHIKTLKIKNNNLMSEGAKAIFEAMAHSSIQVLDITDNFVDAAALAVLAQQVPPTLTRLDVGFNRLDETAVPAVIALTGLPELLLWHNQLGSGVDTLIETLETQKRYPQLDIRYNNLTASQIERLRRHYKKTPDLLKVEPSDLPRIQTVGDLVSYPLDLVDIANIQFAQVRITEELPNTLPQYDPVLDRYPHIRCLPVTRLHDTPAFRYHANTVEVAGRRFIAAQGPLSHAVGDFLVMLAELQIPLVVAVGPASDPTGRVKWTPYWPTEGESSLEVVTQNGEKVSAFLAGQNPNDGLMEREIRIHRASGDTTFRQVHLENWADLAGPGNMTAFSQLLDRLRSVPTAVIHCSAGVGRTGTLLFCLDISDRLTRIVTEKGQSDFLTAPFPMAEWLLQLRQKRVLLVQQPAQYLFCLTWAKYVAKKLANGPT